MADESMSLGDARNRVKVAMRFVRDLTDLDRAAESIMAAHGDVATLEQQRGELDQAVSKLRQTREVLTKETDAQSAALDRVRETISREQEAHRKAIDALLAETAEARKGLAGVRDEHTKAVTALRAEKLGVEMELANAKHALADFHESLKQHAGA